MARRIGSGSLRGTSCGSYAPFVFALPQGAVSQFFCLSAGDGGGASYTAGALAAGNGPLAFAERGDRSLGSFARPGIAHPLDAQRS